jgi:hypothetical protein
VGYGCEIEKLLKLVGGFPNWLIFFRGVETTNQIIVETCLPKPT